MHEILRILLPIIVAHVLVLVAIIIVIKRLLLSDTMRAMERIAAVEAEVRKKEESIRRDIEEHEKDFLRKKAQAEEELQKKREDAEKEVARTREQVVAEAKKDADRILDNAKRNEEKLRAQILLEMEEKAVDYGAQVFKLVFSEKIGEELNRQFIGELLDALEAVDATSITVDAGSAEFTTSHPMDPAQRTRLERLITEKFSVDVKVSEKVRPEILAGMILKLGSLEVDGSLLTRFQEAASEVKKTLAH